MSTVARQYTFTDGTTAYGSEVETEFSTIYTAWNNHNSGTSAWEYVVASTQVKATATSNQLLLGTTRTVTITAPTPASSSRTWTIPDQSGDMSFCSLEGNQTFTGTKTFADGSLVLRGSDAAFSATVRTAAFAAARNYTVPDAGAAASFVMTAGNQTISGIKTFDGQIIGKGTATNDNASSGYIGETQTGTQTSATSFPITTTYGDGTSISLSAGDWLVSALMDTIQNGATGTSVLIGISTTTGNNSTGLTFGDNFFGDVFPTATNNGQLIIPNYRMSLSEAATVYLKVSATYSSGTPQFKCRLTAVRIR